MTYNNMDKQNQPLQTNIQKAWDSSRVSAAIPSGVGFLGAGLIVKSSETDPATGERHHLVQGITTAAATWLSAAVGIACGGGM